MDVLNHRGFFLRARSRSAFTLIEMIVAAAIVSVFVAGAFVAMSQVNRFASAARLRTLALAVAQQRIDEILTTSWQVGVPKPAVLVAGTRTETGLPLNNDVLNSQTGINSAFTALDTQVNVSRVNEITDLSTRRLRAVITVSYTYRNRPYQVSLTTIRTIDTI